MTFIEGQPYALGIAGEVLSAVMFDSTLELLFGEERAFSLRIERDFELTDADGNHTVNFEIEDGSGVAKSTGADYAARLSNLSVVSAVCAANGTLQIEMSNESTIRVAPLEHFEAWTFASPSGVFYCPPGGFVK